MIKNVTRTGLIFKEITLTPGSEEPETAVSEDSSSAAEEEEVDYYVLSRPTATNYTFELSADEDAQFKNPADDEDAHFNNRADEDARDKKVPAAFDLNELPPEEVDEQIHGGGEPPEVAAPVTTEGDEENIPLARQYKYIVDAKHNYREIVFKVGLNSYSRQRTTKAAKKQHNAENKTAVMESLIGSATPGSVYIEPPIVAKDSLWIKWIHGVYLNSGDLWDWIPKKRDSPLLKAVFAIKSALIDRTGSAHHARLFLLSAFKNNIFHISMVYDLLRPKSLVAICWKITWKPCIPRKFSFILWLALKNRLSTKDRSIMEETESDCSLCVGNKESAHHLFLDALLFCRFGRRSGTLLVFQRKQLLSEAQSSGSIGCTKGPGNKIMELLLPLLARFITFGDLETLWFTKL
nr:putative ribonuclease H protein [Ipomoea batatas]